MGRVLRSHPVPFAVALAAGVAVLVVLVLNRGDESPGGTPASAAPGNGDLLSVLHSTIPIPDLNLGPPPPRRVPGPSFRLARIRPGHEVEIRDAPGGRVIGVLGHYTEFGSARTFWIARRHGDWFGVPMPQLPNGRLGWVKDDRISLWVIETHYWIVADVSAHVLELHYGNRVLNRFPITVGSPGSPTPLGDYAITDGLVGPKVGPYYGCCLLALTGHQPHLPANWIGGDRIAIHGTPGRVGGASSAGCLRARDRDMVLLFARVPLGAPVFIRG